MKSICFVFSHLGLGGVQTKIVDLALYIVKTEPQTTIHIILRKKTSFDLSEKLQHPRIHIHVFSSSLHEVRRPFLFTLYLFSLFVAIRPQSVLVFLSPSALPVIFVTQALFWLHIRVVVNEDNLTSGVLSTFAYPLLHTLGIPLLYPCADVIIVPTHAVRQNLIDTFHVPGEKIVMIPNWTLLRENKKIRPVKKYDIVYIGRLDRTKDPFSIFDILKHVVQKNPNIRCAIFGSGNCEAKLRQKIKATRQGQNICIYPPTTDVASVLLQSKILLYYPIHAADGFPVSILEAMAMGVPVVSGYFQGIEDVLVDGKNAYICRSTRQADDKLNALLHLESKRRLFIHEAQKTIAMGHREGCMRAYVNMLT